MRISIVVPAVLLLLAAGSGSAFGFGVGRARVGVRVGPAGAVAGRSVSRAHVGPAGGIHAGTTRGGTYVGPRGTTIQAGRTTGVHVGPLGGVRAGTAQGVRVTTPGGRTYTSGSRTGVGVGPAGGVRVGHAQGAAVRGPYGGGVAVGSRAGVAVGPRGYAVGHRTGYVSAGHMYAWGGRVRTGYTYRYFTPTWYAAHPVAWTTARWATANYWAAVNYATLATYVGLATRPVVYDYGTTIVIQNDEVVVNGERVASAAEYAGQAAALADSGRSARPPESDEWHPLGVFGLMQEDEERAQRTFQLAMNKAGVVRGNYYDAVADNTLPVYGSVDKKTQRVAWSIGEKKEIVFETGLNNLTQEQTTLLVHFGKDGTQQMALIRLEKPDEK